MYFLKGNIPDVDHKPATPAGLGTNKPSSSAILPGNPAPVHQQGGGMGGD
jgi:hypothetical protein